MLLELLRQWRGAFVWEAQANEVGLLMATNAVLREREG